MTDSELEALIHRACSNRDNAIERDREHRNNCRRVKDNEVERSQAGYIPGPPAKYEGQSEPNEHGEVFSLYSGVQL